MTYKELLNEVKRLFRRIRKERDIAYKSKNSSVIKKYEVESQKIKKLTNTKNSFSLGKGKKKNDLYDILEELETFLKTPNITETDRIERTNQRVNQFMNDWQLTRKESERFFDLINSDEVNDLIEQKMFDSDQIIEIARNAVSSRIAIKKLSNLSETEKNEFNLLPFSERVEWFENLLKEVRQRD